MSFSPIQAYTSTTGTTAVAQPIDLTLLSDRSSGLYQAEIETKTTDLVFKWTAPGDTAASDDTVTSGVYPARNYHCLAGTVKVIDIPAGATGFSTKATNVGAVFVNIGFGDST